MQMVGLYKDPTGKDVFSKTVPSDDHQSADVGELRVRVKRLEKRLTEVCDYICMFQAFCRYKEYKSP